MHGEIYPAKFIKITNSTWAFKAFSKLNSAHFTPGERRHTDIAS